MKRITSIKDARDHLTDLVDIAYRTGEQTIITKSGKARAKIVPLAEDEINAIEKNIESDNID